MNKKKVMIFGTFDILHLGHFHLFSEARKAGSELIAVLARDVSVRRIKGHAPFHNENERKKILSHIGLIDKVVLGDKKDFFKVIKKFKPKVIFLGYDQMKSLDKIKHKLKEINLRAKIMSAKPLKLNRYKTTKIKEYLNKFI